MGVPKFFRYMSERYPCLSESLKEYQIPEFDNLYLDMNGIIHNCSHPNDADVKFRITEETIFKNIFHYIEILFRIIQPRKLFFMAVDGVAPRAKINQQRGRRFRSAKEAELLEAKAKAKGEFIPESSRFDSNCITPGTLFMANLNDQLRYFIAYKISTDKLWQKCKVVFSGSEVPGEGEHKIMDYIRYMKSQPDYDNNTRHCLYGLDADLIMLGLCTHEPHFSLLREEVKFGKQQKRILTPEETKFCLLHLSLMREYIEHEFSPVKDKLSFPFDIEKIIDDWVLMGFLVGNDFIPNLPNLHINQGALPVLYHAYMEVLPTLEGYINEAGTLKLDRFEKFMEKLSRVDMEQFAEHYADLKYFEGKTGRKVTGVDRNNFKRSEDSPEEGPSLKKTNSDLDSLIKSTDDMLIGHSDEEDLLDDDSDSDMYNVEFVLHKRDYYMKKLEYENVDEHVLRSQAEGYVRAIQWNLHYYYDGCCSWSWYYPHHYAPYISDIKDFKDLKLEFELGEPFLPFQQLLAVLPAASKTLLPEAFQNLLTEEESPIIDYYPLEFKTDLNGKRQEWEAVVLIPFIDEKNLLEAMKPYYSQLTPEEQKRNKHGPMSIFTYTEQDMGTYEAPAYFPNIQCHAKWELVERSSILVPEDKLVKGLCKGVRLDVYFPGFPTLRHIKHTAGLKKAKVKVFEQPSRGENMMLTIVPQQLPNLNDIAERLLGKSIFVGWPHLVEAQVVAVSNSSLKLNLIQLQMAKISRNIQQEQLQSAAVTQWTSQGNAIKEVYETRYGIDIGDIKVLVHARPIVGRRYAFGTHGKICLEKQWSEVTNTYAYQAIVENVAVADPSFVLYKSIFDIFVAKSVCFMLGHPHYGAFGEVIEPGVNPKNGRVKVAMRIMQEPSLDYNQQNHRDSQNLYANGNIASQRLGITRILLSRITGTIYVMGRAAELTGLPKHNIGLNLKFSKKNEEVPGYTRKDQSGEWLYSPKAIDLVRDYMQKFPRVFERLGKIVKNDIFHEHELFDEGSTEKLGDLTSWLKEQQSHNTESRACNMYGLDAETVQKIQKSIDDFLEQHKNTSKVVVMQVKPHLLYKPGLNLGYLSPDEKATHMLFDRIITVKENFTVPLGYKGTIVAIHKSENVLDITYDVLFDKSFVGGLTLYECSPNRCYRLSPVDFINISYGERVEREKTVGPSDLDMFSGANQSRMHVSPHEFSRNCNMEAPSSENYKSILLPAPPKKVEKRNETKDALQLNQMKPSFEHPPFQIPQHNMNLPKPAFSRNSSTNQVLQSPQDRKPAQSSEFQALWNELHKKPSTPASNALPSPPMAKPNQTPQIPPVRPHALGDLSALLKAMLKIPDDRSQNNTSSRSTTTPTNKNPFPQPSKATDAPPLVQQLFDQARQAEKKKDDIWYCSQLLEHFQLNGRGMPRYNYFNNQGLVQAQIFLPDMRQFVGELCATRDQAAESAAKIAYKALNLDKAPKPNMNVLFPPPMQWYNSRQNTPRVPNRLPMMPPYPQTPPNPLLHQPQWNQKMPQPPNNLPNPAFVRMIPPPPLSNCGPIRPPLPPQQQQQQQQPQQQQQQQQQLHQQHPHHTVHQNSGDIENWRTDKKQTAKNASENWRNDKKNETKKSTPFVPLQAQKRNVNSKLSTSKNTAQNVSQNSKQSPQGGNKKQQDKPQDPVSKDTKESKQNKNDNKTDNIQKTPQSSQPQESSRKRRSRIAANFSSSPLSNGDKPQ